MNKIETNDLKSINNLKPSVRKKLEPVVLDVFSGSDFHLASLREIARRSGVGYATIYRHFGSKEQLLFCFINEWLSALVDRLVDHLQGIENTKERLRKYFWIQFDYYERFPKFGKILMMTTPLIQWMADDTFKQKRLAETLYRVIDEGKREGVLSPDVPNAYFLDFFAGVVVRTFSMWVYRGQKDSLTGKANQLFEMIWNGISNKDKG